MIVKQMRALRGANYYHKKPVIYIQVELGDLEYKPSDEVPNMVENLKEMLPHMEEHFCSPGKRGGFFQRVKRGTWAGHVAEHIALELQSQIGHAVTFGKTYTRKPKGTYDIVYRYLNEQVGLRAGEMAIEITNNLYAGKMTEVAPLLEELQELACETEFGPSTQAIVDAAKKRGIPYIRLNEYSYVQLGQGKHQRKIEATLMDDTSALGVEIAADKDRTKTILSQSGVPVPKGEVISTWDEALRAAEKIGYPVVLKPLDGNHGRDVILNIKNKEELQAAFELLKDKKEALVIENYLKGNDYRLLVVGGKLIAAAKRIPPFVVGDGEKTVQQLIEALNADPDRGHGHEKRLTKVTIDDETMRLLDIQKHTLQSVPEAGEEVQLKATANISTGGSAEDVTDIVHPMNHRMAERIARTIGLNVMGIDMIAESLEQPLVQENGGVIEVNAGPGFRMHVAPSIGKPRDVAGAVVDMLFPEGKEFLIPTVAVTGTNGKTTTTRLISHILTVAGHQVGMASTDTVSVDDVPILKGDYSGPDGAKAVMRDSQVEYAVLEVARGGIIRRGLGFDHCDVAVLLNVTSDHLGLGGIDTLEELLRVKATIFDALGEDDFGVLNADDPLVLSELEKLHANPILFSKNANHPALLENLEKGHCNVTVLDETIILQKPAGVVDIAKIDEIPITFEGTAMFNVENVMAAVAATYALGVQEEKIAVGITSFSPSIAQSPGRMNLIDMGTFKVLIDYGHNIGAVKATADFIEKLGHGRKIRMASGVGNRREEDILAFGRALAPSYDYVVICDPSPRVRKLGETAEILKRGFIEGGLKEEQIDIHLHESDATQAVLEMAQPGDLIVLQVENIQQVTEKVLQWKKEIIES